MYAHSSKTKSISAGLLRTRCKARNFLTNSTRFQCVKYRPCTESTINNRSTPTLGFGKVLDSSLPYFRRYPFAWPASLQVILKNDAKWSFSEPRRDMFSQRFQNDDRISVHATYLKHSKIAVSQTVNGFEHALSVAHWTTRWRRCVLEIAPSGSLI